MTKVPAFGLLGNTAKDLLYGGKEGKFHYDKIVNVSSTTSDGVDFGITAVQKEDKLEMAAKAVYNAPKYTVLATVSQAGKIAVATTHKDLAPGLVLGVSGVADDPESGKLAVDYAMPHLTLKSVLSLTAAPKVDVAATTGYNNLTAGGEASYDTSKSAVTKWVVGLGYTAADYQAALLYNDKNTVTGLVAHRVNGATTVGAEVTRDLGANATTFAAGLAKRLEGGALAKVKLNNEGIVSVLYEQELRPKTRLALTGQFNALAMDKPPKYGVGYDIKY